MAWSQFGYDDVETRITPRNELKHCILRLKRCLMQFLFAFPGIPMASSSLSNLAIISPIFFPIEEARWRLRLIIGLSTRRRLRWTTFVAISWVGSILISSTGSGGRYLRFSGRPKAIEYAYSAIQIHNLDAVVKSINATETKLCGGNLRLQ